MLSQLRNVCFLISIGLISCHSSNDTDSKYPIDSFFLQEMKLIDSLPMAVFHIKTEKEISDTSIIDKKAFREMVGGLFLNEMSYFSQRKNFTESILEDTQLNETTITYTNTRQETGLLKIELHIRTGETGLRSVYMERNDLASGVSRFRKMLWITGKSLSVNTAVYANRTETESKTDRFVWEMLND